MTNQKREVGAETKLGGMFWFLGQSKIWWLLTLVVLLALLGIIYLLTHLSVADTEMYPTTQLRQSRACSISC